MFIDLLNKWKETDVEESSTRLTVREANLLESFAIWLDRDAELPLERKSGTCPSCFGEGIVGTKDTAFKPCPRCKGTGHV